MITKLQLFIAAILACSSLAPVLGTQRGEDDDMPVMHMILLQFTLDGDDPYEFASYAPEFADNLETILARDTEFDNVNAVVLGVGKTDCGVTVIAVVEYTKNQTGVYMDTATMVQHIIDLIESNNQMFEDLYSMKSVRSVDADDTNVKFVRNTSTLSSSTKVAVGVVVGSLALIGVAMMVTGMVVYVMRARNYERVPLLADEGAPSRKSWFKFPWNKKSSDKTEAF